MQVNEDTAAVVAGVLVGIGYALKALIKVAGKKSDDDETTNRIEERRASASILSSMRDEISRLNDLVNDLGRRLDEEVGKRRALEVENGRLRGEIERITRILSRRQGND